MPTQQPGPPTQARIRPYRGTGEDLAALAHVRNETLRRTTLPEDYLPFTPDDMAGYYNHGGFSLAGHAWLMLSGDEAVGAAVIYPAAAYHDRPPGNFHLYVVPSMWRHGLGARLLEYVERQAAAQGYPVLETTIAAEDTQSTRFLEARGFHVVGQAHHLVRPDLDSLPDAPVPAGYTLRALADLEDGGPELYVETTNRLGAYDSSYSLVNEDEVRTQVEQGRFDPQGVIFLFEAPRRIVGVIRATTSPQGRGYLNEIRLEPASRGKGLGLAMVATALHYLRVAGMKRAELDTAGENRAAYNLALRAGFSHARHWLHFLKRLEPGAPANEPERAASATERSE